MEMLLTSVAAECPHCHSQLPLGLEQSAWLHSGGRIWLFCSLPSGSSMESAL
jgi:hypothetical protein